MISCLAWQLEKYKLTNIKLLTYEISKCTRPSQEAFCKIINNIKRVLFQFVASPGPVLCLHDTS